jgi:hypothetical protein
VLLGRSCRLRSVPKTPVYWTPNRPSANALDPGRNWQPKPKGFWTWHGIGSNSDSRRPASGNSAEPAYANCRSVPCCQNGHRRHSSSLTTRMRSRSRVQRAKDQLLTRISDPFWIQRQRNGLAAIATDAINASQFHESQSGVVSPGPGTEQLADSPAGAPFSDSTSANGSLIPQSFPP